MAPSTSPRADISDALVAEFLRHACLSYDHDDWPEKWRRAERIRVRHHEVCRADLYTAVVTGEVDLVDEILSRDAAAVSARGGPQGWEPLLFLCYGRLPSPRAGESSLAIARTLLDRGADPNTHFVWGGTLRFSALTGAIGRGELGQPSHPRARELAMLLLGRGANPNDSQALYNDMLAGDDDGWLRLLFAHGLSAADRVNWDAFPPAEGPPPMRVVDFLLGHAVKHDHRKRISCLLEHEADPNARDHYDGRSAFENAVLAGNLEVAEVLVRHGAKRRALTGRDAFVAACMRADGEAARMLLAGHPDYLEGADPLIAAIESGRIEVLRLLLDLGIEADREAAHGKRALHVAAGQAKDNDACHAMVDLLLERGADPRARCYGGTPAGWALTAGRADLARMLAKRSRLPHDAAASGHAALLAEVLAEHPDAARSRDTGGNTPLHRLPEDVARAREIVNLLLARGADLEAMNDAGHTPAQAAEARGLDEVADLIRVRL